MAKYVEMTVPQGGDIKQCIVDFLVSQDTRDAVIIGAVGSAKDVVVANPVEHELPLKPMSTIFHEAVEVVALNGEAMEWDRVPAALKQVYPDRNLPLFLHLHCACAMIGGHVFGGGLWGGTAFRSLRVFIFLCDKD